MNPNTDFIKDWCNFGEHRVYILMGIARRKHNEELTHSSEVVHRKVLREKDDIDEQYWDLKNTMDRYGYTYRIYLTVNARNVFDSFFKFQERLTDIIKAYEYGHDGAAERMKKLDSEWKSTIHQPSVKDDSYFMFDCDRSSFIAETLRMELEEHTNVVEERDTPNGWHFITEPFNHNKLPAQAKKKYDDLSTDGMVFVYEGNND